MLGKGLAGTVHRAVMKPFRALVDVDRASHSQSSDHQVLARLQLLTPSKRIRLLRLSLYSRIVQKSSQTMRRVLALGAAAAGSWAAAVADDLMHLVQHAATTMYADWSVLQWQATALNNPALFRAAAVKVLDAAPRTLIDADIRLPEEMLLEMLQCSSCDGQFATRQALCAHAFRAHGTRVAARQHVETTHCTCCLLQLWTRQRLLDHLRRSQPCTEHTMRLPRLEEDVVQRLDDEARECIRANTREGRHRNWAAMPSAVLSGPRPHSG